MRRAACHRSVQRNEALALHVGLEPDDLDLYGTCKATVCLDADQAHLLESGEWRGPEARGVGG